jgi:hypothetical protein
VEDAVALLGGMNAVSALLVVVVIVSALQGAARGASHSARHFIQMIAEGAITLAGLFVAWNMAGVWSEPVQAWLIAQNITLPQGPVNGAVQLYYTLMTGIRDFSLLRLGLLFIIIYSVVKHGLYMVFLLIWSAIAPHPYERRTVEDSHLTSGIIGGGIGAIIGSARAFVLIALMFVYTSCFPSAPMAGYIQQSDLYQQAASRMIEPVAGKLVHRLPIITQEAGEQLGQILQRRYEIIDARIPGNIAQAAQEITADGMTDEEKAKLLYQWVGTRVRYDWEKVRLYEEEQIWNEQTPEDTFASRAGVCIDYSRLYAVMARSVGLEVKVVTGLGYDGRGGYGPHAWNEVYASEQERWIPLDSTWVSSGGNWFDTPGFDKTHIRDTVEMAQQGKEELEAHERNHEQQRSRDKRAA